MKISTVFTEALVVTGPYVANATVTTELRSRQLKVTVGPGPNRITVQTGEGMDLTQLQTLINRLVTKVATATAQR